MHNHVVRRHRDGNVSVSRRHTGILSLRLPVLLCVALIKWLTQTVVAAAWEPIDACFHPSEQLSP